MRPTSPNKSLFFDVGLSYADIFLLCGIAEITKESSLPVLDDEVDRLCFYNKSGVQMFQTGDSSNKQKSNRQVDLQVLLIWKERGESDACSFGTGMSLYLGYACVVFWITGSCIAVATLSPRSHLLYCRVWSAWLQSRIKIDSSGKEDVKPMWLSVMILVI